MYLNWIVNRWTSLIHCSHQLSLARPLPGIHDWTPLRDVVLRLTQDFVDAGLASETEQRVAWQKLLEASMRADSACDVAELLGGVLPKNTSRSGLTQRMNEAALVFREMFPNLEKQLEWRMQPLREQWEAYGPGLLAHAGRLVPACKSHRGKEAAVQVMQPICGGFGASHPDVAAVRIEAVLTNPLQELPEVVRLGWLLMQLQLPSWRPSLSIEERLIEPIGVLALLPPALAAGQVVELCRIDEPHVSLAIEQWQVAAPREVAQTATILLSWWEAYLQTNSDWPIALTALQRSLLA